MAEGGGWGSAPMAGAQGEEGRVEVTEGAEEEEKGCVCGCGGEGGGSGVGDVDFVGGACWDVESSGESLLLGVNLRCGGYVLLGMERKTY